MLHPVHIFFAREEPEDYRSHAKIKKNDEAIEEVSNVPPLTLFTHQSLHFGCMYDSAALSSDFVC